MLGYLKTYQLRFNADGNIAGCSLKENHIQKW